jgi:hypothetical protein
VGAFRASRKVWSQIWTFLGSFGGEVFSEAVIVGYESLFFEFFEYGFSHGVYSPASVKVCFLSDFSYIKIESSGLGCKSLKC